MPDMPEPAYIAGLATTLRHDQARALRDAENELQHHRARAAAVAHFIADPTHDLDTRNALAHILGLPAVMDRPQGLTMSATSTAHARLAALIRHRGEHDPAVLAARVELAQACAGGTIRRSVAYLPPATRRRLLDVLDTSETEDPAPSHQESH